MTGGPTPDPLDASFAARSDDNRWNRRGEPTPYLAGDPRVLVSEWGRHVESAAIDPAIVRRTVPRRVFRMTVVLDHVLDLRDPDLCAALALPDAPHWFLDRARCQTTASRLRQTTAARALLVPSVALLDQLDR